MFYKFYRLINLIKNMNRYKLCIIISFIFLIICVIYRKIKGLKGTWTNNFSDIIIMDDILHSNKIEGNNQINNQGRDSKGEIECKRVLEKIFNRPFNKYRPNFLRNPITGGNNNLELDCYNEDIKIAVEYNGRQHYEFVPFFHKNREAFMNQKYRDELKRIYCKENNVLLIEVPYTVKIKDIERYIKIKLGEKEV